MGPLHGTGHATPSTASAYSFPPSSAISASPLTTSTIRNQLLTVPPYAPLQSVVTIAGRIHQRQAPEAIDAFTTACIPLANFWASCCFVVSTDMTRIQYAAEHSWLQSASTQPFFRHYRFLGYLQHRGAYKRGFMLGLTDGLGQPERNCCQQHVVQKRARDSIAGHVHLHCLPRPCVASAAAPSFSSSFTGKTLPRRGRQEKHLIEGKIRRRDRADGR